MKKLILLFIGSIILFSLWKCVFFPSKDSTSSSENFPIPSSSSDTTSKEPNESDAVLKSSNSMRESLSSSSSTSDEPFSTDESNDYKSEELIDTTAQKFFSVPENLRFLYKGIIIKHNKTEPTYTKTSLFLCEKRRFFMARTKKGGKSF